jgi:ATP-dependent RNA helicase RhlE
MSFDRLGLSPELLRAVADEGYVTPTPVQAEAIPHVLAGRDLMAGAQTGTGKTAAFVLPILQRLASRPGRPASDPRARRPRVLVLVPTRELALQVEESVRVYGRHAPARSVAIYGGVGYDTQVRAFRRGVDIVVATPGRLIDHLGLGNVDLSAVEILVLDEADRMLDMGFIRDIRRILGTLPASRQSLLFSATFSPGIRELATSFLRDPATVQVAPANRATELVRQVVIRVDRERKRDLLRELVASGRVDQALVFARTKHGADRLAKQLDADGIPAAAIHGNRSQGQRVRALDDFKAGRITLLVATEVAARGIDIEELPHVVNFELPMVPEDYVHRIGRTGRAGSEGDAISLVCVDEGKLLGDIERLLGRRIPTEVVPGFEPDRSIRPEPIRLRTGGNPGPAPRRGPAPAPHAPRAPHAPHVPHRNPRRPAAHGAPRPAYAHAGARPSTVAPAGAPRTLPGERLRRAGHGA